MRQVKPSEERTTHGAKTTSYLHLDVRFKVVSAIRGRNDRISLFRRIVPTRSGSVFKSAEICLQKWGELYSKSGTSRLLKWDELSSKVGRVVLGRVLCGASCLGASCLWGELS